MHATMLCLGLSIAAGISACKDDESRNHPANGTAQTDTRDPPMEPSADRTILKLDRESYGFKRDEVAGIHAAPIVPGEREAWVTQIGLNHRKHEGALRAPAKYLLYVWLPSLGLISQPKHVETKGGDVIELTGLTFEKWATLNVTKPDDVDGLLFVGVWMDHGGPKLRGDIHYDSQIGSAYDFSLPPGHDLEVRYYIEPPKGGRLWGSAHVSKMTPGERREVRLAPLQ